MDVDKIYEDWSIPATARHNVRVICDQVGLDWDQKQTLTACVYQESRFDVNATHVNYGHDSFGHPFISSIDYGIVQVNDYWQIKGHGKGSTFESVEYVMNNPEACVRWMAEYYKKHGDLRPWCSYTSGAYKQWLGRV